VNDLRGYDPGAWGHSLANLSEILVELLDAAGARSVAEVGAYAGDLTRELLAWAEPRGASVTAIDPDPQDELIALSEERPDLDLIRRPSLEALPDLPPTDAVVIDGDHNHYTVLGELRLIGDRFTGSDMPLLLLHDVCWPHGRRDAYYEPGRIPPEGRRPMRAGGGVVPGEAGLVEGGLPYAWVAEREGGPANGVLTALEDFAADRDDIRVAVVPAFFGLGIAWHAEVPWATEVARVLEPWDDNPVVARLEANRVYHLARRETIEAELKRAEARDREKADLLRGLLESRAFRIGERLASLRNPGRDSWRQSVRRVLEDDR
jgi:SAM-dependent methyltransferase